MKVIIKQSSEKVGSIAMKEKSKIPTPKKSWSDKNQSGAAMVEYALLVALILTGCITAVQTIGDNADVGFTKAANALASAQVTN